MDIRSQLGEPAVTKPELGTKRLCAHCGAKFYDLHHSPVACPKCGRAFDAVRASSPWRSEASRAPVDEAEPVVAEIPGAQLISLEDADAETEGEHGFDDGAEDVVEPDDEALNGVALIEESEHEDDGDDIEQENDVEDGN
jgi:uncharacterized protein (TIGR02300 family)